MNETKLTCTCCKVESIGDFSVQFDEEKKKRWDEEHAKRLELKTKQELILAEFERIANEHNSHWYNFLSTWHVCPRPFEDFLDIDNFMHDKPIKSVPYDNSVMGCWLNFIYIKPVFEYIECPVCHRKNYLKQCSHSKDA